MSKLVSESIGDFIYNKLTPKNKGELAKGRKPMTSEQLNDLVMYSKNIEGLNIEEFGDNYIAAYYDGESKSIWHYYRDDQRVYYTEEAEDMVNKAIRN